MLRREGNKQQLQLEYNNEALNVRAIDSALAREVVARGTAEHVTDRSHDHSHACHVTQTLLLSPAFPGIDPVRVDDNVEPEGGCALEKQAFCYWYWESQTASVYMYM